MFCLRAKSLRRNREAWAFFFPCKMRASHKVPHLPSDYLERHPVKPIIVEAITNQRLVVHVATFEADVDNDAAAWTMIADPADEPYLRPNSDESEIKEYLILERNVYGFRAAYLRSNETYIHWFSPDFNVLANRHGQWLLAACDVFGREAISHGVSSHEGLSRQ